MKKIFTKSHLYFVFMVAAALVTLNCSGQTNPVAQSLPYTQNFSSLTGSTTAYPAGIQGWNIPGSMGTAFATAAPDANQALIAPGLNTQATAQVADFVGKMGVYSNSSNLKSIVVSIVTTSTTGITVSFDAGTQRNENTRVCELGLQYRVGTSGTFTNIASSTYQNTLTPTNTSGTGAINVQNVSVALPVACENKPVVQLRWVIRDVSGSGNRCGFSIDNINIASATPSSTVTITAQDQDAPSLVDWNTNSTNNIFYWAAITPTTPGATLSSVKTDMTGTYLSADIATNGFKLYYSADFTFTPGAGPDVLLGSQSSAKSGASESITWSSLSQAFSTGNTGYIYATADVTAAATPGRTVIGTFTGNSNIIFSPTVSYSGANTYGTTAAKTIKGPTNPSTFNVSCASEAKINVSMNAPTYGTVLVFANTTNSFTAPTGAGSGFTGASTNYGTATNYPAVGGRLIYSGSGANFSMTSLAAGSTYYFKAYTYLGSTWTSGTATINGVATTQPVTGLSGTPTVGQITLNWTNPGATACISNVIVIARAVTAVEGDVSKANFDGLVSDADFTGATSIWTSNSNANDVYDLTANLIGTDNTNFLVYKGTGNSVVLTGLTAGTTYHYSVFTVDGVGASARWSARVDANATVPTGTITLSPTTQSFSSFCNGSSNSIALTYTQTGTITAPYIELSTPLGAFPGTNIGGVVSGAGPTFTITGSIPAATTIGTAYRVRIVSTDGTPIVSANNNSNIAIYATPGLPASSTPAAVCEGSSVTITGAGSAGATTYTYWTASSGGTQYTTGSPAGYTVTAGNLTTPAALAAGSYNFYVQGQNAALCAGTSRQLVVVTINPLPATPAVPTSNSPQCTPSTVTITRGTPPVGETWYWQTAANGTSTANSATTYVVSAAGATTIHLRAQNNTTLCWSAASSNVTVNINTPVSITTQPTTQNVTVGNTATYSVVAAGTSPTYQWQVSTDCGANWNNVTTGTGGNSASYTTVIATTGMNGNQYRVVVTNSCGSVTSNIVYMNVISESDCLSTSFISTEGWANVTGYTTDWTQTVGGNVWIGSKVLVDAGANSRIQIRDLNTWLQLPNLNYPASLVISARNSAAGTGGTDDLKLQYYNGTVWTDVATLTIGSLGNYTYNLSAFSNQTNVQIRLIKVTASNTIYLEAATVKCTSLPGTPTDYVWSGGANTTSWSDPCNWSPKGVPTAVDNVTFNTSPAYLLNIVDSRAVNNLTLNGTGYFNMASTGVLTINGSVTYAATASAALDCNSTIKYASSGSITIPALNYGHLDASGGNRTLPSSGTVGICSTFTPGAGTYTVPGSTVNYFSPNTGTTFTMLPFNYHNLTFSGASTFTFGAGNTINVAGNFLQSNGNVNVIDNASGTSNLNVTGDMSITGGIFDLSKQSGGTGNVTLKGNLAISNTAIVRATSTTAANNSFTFSGTGDGSTPALTQTIDFINATTAQRVNFNVNSGAYVKLINQNLALGTSGSFRVKTGGIFDFGFDGLNGVGTNALNVVPVSAQTLQTFTTESGSTIKITSPYGITNVAAGATAGNVQIPTASRVFNADGIYHYIGKANQVTGNVLPSAASAKKVIVELQTTNPANDNLTFKSTNGIIRFTSAGILEIRKGTVIDESAVGFEDGPGMTDLGKLTMTGGRYLISRSGTQPALSGVYTLDAGVIEFAHTNGSFTTTESIRGGASYQYPNIEVTGEDVYHVNGNVNLKAAGSLTVKSGATLTSTVNSEQIASVNTSNKATLTLENNAIFKTASAKGFYGPPDGINPAASVRNDVNLNLLAGSTVNYARETTNLPSGALNGNQEITALPGTYAYQNLSISGTGDKTAPSGTLTILGNFDKSGATTEYKHNDGTVVLAGTVAAQNITSTLPTPIIIFNNLTDNNPVGVEVKSDFGVAKELLLGANAKLNLKYAFNIHLKSTAINTANVAEIPASASIDYTGGTGRFIVERYIASGITHGRSWQFVATPVQSDFLQTVKKTWMENLGNTTGLGVWLTGPSYTTNFDGTTNGPSIKSYNSTSLIYQGLNNADSTLANVHGWMVFVRGDRNAKPTNAISNSTTLRSTGKIYAPVAGNAPASIPVGINKYESVGNPYASSIDLMKVGRNSLTNEIYIWDPTLGGGYGLGGYRTLTLNAGKTHYLVSPGGGAYPSGVVDTLQSGQAFFVKGDATGPSSVSFTEAAKVSGSKIRNREGNGVQGSDAEMLFADLYIKSDIEPSILADGALAIFGDGYSTEVDWEDGMKLLNGTDNAGFRRDGKYLAVERRPTPKAGDTLHLDIANVRVQSYEWQFSPTQMGADLNRKAWLYDKFLGTKTPLNLESTSNIGFTVTSDAASAATDRFKILFTNVVAAPTPVTFTSISASRNTDRSIAVKWTVENEVNITAYTVERSADGLSFSGILTQAATNSHGYLQTDLSPLAQDNYYRIKATSLGGQVQYSAIVKVAPLNAARSISVYPNPVEGKTVQLTFTNVAKGTYQLQVINKLGQTIYIGTAVINSNSFVKQLPLGQTTTAGTYQLKIVATDGTVTTQQLIVQ